MGEVIRPDFGANRSGKQSGSDTESETPQNAGADIIHVDFGHNARTASMGKPLPPEEEAGHEKQPYREHAVANGVDIAVYWDADRNEYEIQFSDIEMSSDEARANEVYDQVINLQSADPKVAKEIFGMAVGLAFKNPDPYAAYREIQDIVLGNKRRTP